MKGKIFDAVIWRVAVLLLLFIATAGFLNRKSDLYKNMIDASVLITADSGGYGSGVFIDDNVIVTAAHCLGHADIYIIELSDGTTLEANDFYIDDEEDVGFIFVDVNELHIAKVTPMPGDIGDTVYLVGSPYFKSLKFTITRGILSNLDRDIWGQEDLLQTDAEGAQGSSGGPLYDSEGRMIGICVSGPVNGGGVTLCESGKSILEAYERCLESRNAPN